MIDVNEETLAKIALLPATTRSKVMRELGEQEWKRCADDVFYWLDSSLHIPYVYTEERRPPYECKICPQEYLVDFSKRKAHLKEFHDVQVEDPKLFGQYFKETSYKRKFPMKDYFTPIINTWLSEPLMLVCKSRDMMATWLFLILYTWDTIFHGGRENFVQSETAAKTYDLISRANFVIKSQPKWLRDVHPVSFQKGEANSGLIKVEGLNSELKGLPQGADQIRQYHPSGVFTDETAFHKDAGEVFAAVKPAIQAGGRYTGVSSAYPGWFQLAVQDKLEMDS